MNVYGKNNDFFDDIVGYPQGVPLSLHGIVFLTIL